MIILNFITVIGMNNFSKFIFMINDPENVYFVKINSLI